MLRCPGCRSRRSTYKALQQHLKLTGHKLCTCGGYHYAHRPGSPYCHGNPLSVLREAWRRDEPEEVLLMIAASIVDDSPELRGKVEELCESLNLRMD